MDREEKLGGLQFMGGAVTKTDNWATKHSAGDHIPGTRAVLEKRGHMCTIKGT